MLATAKKFNEVMNKFKDKYVKLISSEEMFKSMDSDTFEMMQMSLEAIDLAQEMQMKQAEEFELISIKLDNILRKVESH